MTEKKPSNLLVNPQGGVVRDTLNRLKLIVRLMADNRVNIFAKLIPLGALVYLISPADLLPGVVIPFVGALDDAAVLWLGSYVFTELCPPAVVEEHMKAITSNYVETDDVVDAESTDVSDKPL